MQDVPKYILRFATKLILFKTHDNPAYVKQTFGEVNSRDGNLYEKWNAVNEAAKNHKFFSTYPPPKGVAPPMDTFSMY